MSLVHSFGKHGEVRRDEYGELYMVKWVNRSRHFLRKSRSWGFDYAITTKMRELGVRRILLLVDGEGTYEASMDDMNKHSTIERFKDYEEQEFLNEEYWERVY